MSIICLTIFAVSLLLFKFVSLLVIESSPIIISINCFLNMDCSSPIDTYLFFLFAGPPSSPWSTDSTPKLMLPRAFCSCFTYLLNLCLTASLIALLSYFWTTSSPFWSYSSSSSDSVASLPNFFIRLDSLVLIRLDSVELIRLDSLNSFDLIRSVGQSAEASSWTTMLFLDLFWTPLPIPIRWPLPIQSDQRAVYRIGRQSIGSDGSLSDRTAEYL